MVNYDVDGICASKILQSLFRCESITYTLVPVEGLEDVKTTFSEHCDEVILNSCVFIVRKEWRSLI